MEKQQRVNRRLLRWCQRIATVVLIFFFPVACIVVSKLDAFASSGTAPQANIVQPDAAYTGLFYHQRSGLYLAEHRAFDSGLKRWLNRDPAGEAADVNLYRYAAANSVRYRDTSGYDAWVPTNRTTTQDPEPQAPTYGTDPGVPNQTNPGLPNTNPDPGLPNNTNNPGQPDQTTNPFSPNNPNGEALPNNTANSGAPDNSTQQVNPLTTQSRNDNDGMTGDQPAPRKEDNTDMTTGNNGGSRNDNNGMVTDPKHPCPIGKKPSPTPAHK
jgi:RHS repeat-associated protein